jgi:mono/diheme cytochrome c family protein
MGLTLTVFGAAATVEGASTTGPSTLDFNRDIRPILSEHCYACHGPDENKRKAGLRLDRQEDAFKELKEGRHALIAGDLEHSTLAVRVASSDPDEVMPPPKFGKPLSASETALLRRWVSEGAAWKKHWAFLPPEHLPVPSVTNTPWVRNELDHFILSRLEKEGLQPNPEADRATLIRRATLDLTGLPPTVAEVDQFLADPRKDAYEQMILPTPAVTILTASASCGFGATG